MPAVRQNLGLGLLAQCGVAIGLALTSAVRFASYGEEGQALGLLIVNVITATTFILQIAGPIGVKFAINRSGEALKARLEPDAWASQGTPK